MPPRVAQTQWHGVQRVSFMGTGTNTSGAHMARFRAYIATGGLGPSLLGGHYRWVTVKTLALGICSIDNL